MHSIDFRRAFLSSLSRSASISHAHFRKTSNARSAEKCAPHPFAATAEAADLEIRRKRARHRAHFLLSTVSFFSTLLCVWYGFWEKLYLWRRARALAPHKSAPATAAAKTMPAHNAFITRCRPHFLIIITADHLQPAQVREVVRESEHAAKTTPSGKWKKSLLLSLSVCLGKRSK